jgi:hypothetical protein
MAKTNAERQAAYRQRHLKTLDGKKARINLIIDYSTKVAIERLARCYGITQAELLGKIVSEEQQRLADRLGISVWDLKLQWIRDEEIAENKKVTA